MLSCILCWSICLGFTMAIVAGIAYGYNYMLAEFLTIGRTDVAIYIRRGQFYDKQDLGTANARRLGDDTAEEQDLFSSNTSDYQEKVQPDSGLLSDTWRKALDTRKYAEKLIQHPKQFRADNLTAISMEKGAVNVVTRTAPPHNKPTPMRKHSAIMIQVTQTPGRTKLTMRHFPVEEITISPKVAELYDETHQADDAKYTSQEKLLNTEKPNHKGWIFTPEYHADVDEDIVDNKPV